MRPPWHTFRHGVHPPDHKDLTASIPIRRLPFPDEIVLPLRQHAGKPARPIVREGDRVERGDTLATADGQFSAPIHASAAGRVAAIEFWPHPEGVHAPAIRIEVERYSPQALRPRIIPEWKGLTREELIAAVRESGVVGLGGAAFPAHIKLSPPPEFPIDTLVVNGCECEPYLTTDHRTMVEYPDRVQLGIRIMLSCLRAKRAVVGIERNKPDAIAAIKRTLPADLDVSVLDLRVKYPQGAEKLLIKAVLGREVPSGSLPMHVGVVVQNVASLATIAEVFETGLPLIERIVTVTGHGIKNPANLIVPVGTKLRDLVDACGGFTPDAREIVFGGPMMGVAQADLDVPITKGTTGVIVLSRDECKTQQSWACIRCGHCLDACPVFLNPQLLGALAKAGRYDEMNEHRLGDCMLCGSCTYVCPSNIPLSQLFVAAKAQVRRLKVA